MVNRLQAVDYKVRLLTYYRHRKLFDSYKKRNQFLSKGFENSALAAQKQGRLLGVRDVELYLDLFLI